MIKENRAIKLKENFLLLINPRINKEVIVLDKKNEKIILKLDVEKMLQQYALNFDEIGKNFTSMFTLTRTLEGQLMLKIYSTYPDLFEVEACEANGVKLDYMDYEYTKTIDPVGLFTTYSFKDNRPNYVCVLWGVNEVNETLIQSLSKMQIPIALVSATMSELQDIQCIKFLTSRNYTNIDSYYEKLIADFGIKIIDTGFDRDQLDSPQAIHIIDNRLIDYQLVDVQPGKDLVLHYGFYTNKFTIGPLVINEASYGYDSFKQAFQSRLSLPTTPQSLIVAAIVNRTIYYVMKNTLKYLAEDAQLPINQVFAFDNYSFTSEVIDIEIESYTNREGVLK